MHHHTSYRGVQSLHATCVERDDLLHVVFAAKFKIAMTDDAEGCELALRRDSQGCNTALRFEFRAMYRTFGACELLCETTLRVGRPSSSMRQIAAVEPDRLHCVEL